MENYYPRFRDGGPKIQLYSTFELPRASEPSQGEPLPPMPRQIQEPEPRIYKNSVPLHNQASVSLYGRDAGIADAMGRPEIQRRSFLYTSTHELKVDNTDTSLESAESSPHVGGALRLHLPEQDAAEAPPASDPS